MSSLSRLDSSSSSSDDDDELILSALHIAHTQYKARNVPRWGGSVVGREYIHRDRVGGAWRLYNDYFSENPTYGRLSFDAGLHSILQFGFEILSLFFSCVFLFVFLSSGLEWVVLSLCA